MKRSGDMMRAGIEDEDSWRSTQHISAYIQENEGNRAVHKCQYVIQIT